MPIKKKTTNKTNTIIKPKSNTKPKSKPKSKPTPKLKTIKVGGGGTTGTSSSKKQDDSLRTSPKNISNMPDDVLLNILSSSFPIPKIGNKLDSSLISEILVVANVIYNKSIINKHFAIVSPMILEEPLFDKINIINLEDLLITKAVVGVLNMTDPDKILCITLKRIKFDNYKTCDNFFQFFSENVKVKVLIYDCVCGVKTSVFLNILQKFRHIEWLEIGRSSLYNKNINGKKYKYFENFMQVLLNSTSLQYLMFYDNTVEQEFSKLWSNKSESDNIETIIKGKPYKIYISRYDFDINCYGMKIVKVGGMGGNRKPKEELFQVHIYNNSFSSTGGKMQNALNIFTYRKDILDQFREFIGDRVLK
jgi:hypothetical protein